MEEDKNGYLRSNTKHSNLWHRKVAYLKIYQKNREKYPLRFSKYEVHHIDGNKKNNLVENLAILTEEEHVDVHQNIDTIMLGGSSRKKAGLNAWNRMIEKKETEKELKKGKEERRIAREKEKKYLQSLGSQKEIDKYHLKKQELRKEKEDKKKKEKIKKQRNIAKRVTRLREEAERLRINEVKRKSRHFLLFLFILILTIFVVKNFDKNQSSTNFDITAINTNVSQEVSTSEGTNNFCETICGNNKLTRCDEREGSSVIRCYCEGISTKYFDFRTKKEIGLAEVKNRNSYLNEYWRNYGGPDPKYEEIYSKLSLGMDAGTFGSLAYNERFEWSPSFGESKEFDLFQYGGDKDRIKVYFDEIAQKMVETTGIIVSPGGKVSERIFTDARIIKIELYYDGKKIDEK